MFDDRIFHEWAPQNVSTWPILVFRQIAASEVAPDMEAPDDAKLDQYVYQFDVYARKSTDVIEASDAFDSIFRNFRGTMSAVRIQTVERVNITQIGEIVGDKQIRRVSLDYQIFFVTN